VRVEWKTSRNRCSSRGVTSSGKASSNYLTIREIFSIFLYSTNATKSGEEVLPQAAQGLHVRPTGGHYESAEELRGGQARHPAECGTPGNIAISTRARKTLTSRPASGSDACNSSSHRGRHNAFSPRTDRLPSMSGRGATSALPPTSTAKKCGNDSTPGGNDRLGSCSLRVTPKGVVHLPTGASP
jgi:hypothetical protein